MPASPVGIVASDLFKDKTACGTWQYWLVVLSAVPVILVISFLVRFAYPISPIPTLVEGSYPAPRSHTGAFSAAQRFFKVQH